MEEKEQSFFDTPFVTITASVLTTFIIGAIFFRLAGPLPVSITQTTTDKAAPFSVTGEGSVFVKPDEAKATFSITSNAQTVAKAQSDADSVIQTLTKNLASLGVSDKDIQTTQYSVYPQYSQNLSQNITGYSATVQIEVTFRDFDKLNQALSVAASSGANMIGQVSLTVSDEERAKAEDKAREIAVQNAKDKAQKIANVSGLRLGKITNVTENNQRPPIVMPLAAGESQGKISGPQINPGETKITDSVTLSYETL